MNRSIILLSIAFAASGVEAQSLVQRVAAVRDGGVRFRYASRPEACGDGDRFIRLRDVVFAGSGRNISIISGRIQSDHRCVQGLAEARIEVAKGQVVSVRSALPPTGSFSGTDLGVVPAGDAATFFLDLLRVQGDLDDHRIFIGLVLADSASLWQELLKIGRGSLFSEEKRSSALSWAGWDGDAAARDPLAVFLRDSTVPRKIREGAAAGLSRTDDPAATRILTDFVRAPGDPKLRGHIVHLVEDNDGALTAWRAMAADASVAEEVRMAIFLVLGNSDEPQDGRLLRSLLPTLDSKRLRERLMIAVSERDEVEGGRWLIQIAQTEAEPYETRKRALFWAGQSELPARELVAVYDKLKDRKLREHMIFVISERKEAEATDKLIAIAKGDVDFELRKKAMFWMGQRDDPRRAAFLAEILR